MEPPFIPSQPVMSNRSLSLPTYNIAPSDSDSEDEIPLARLNPNRDLHEQIYAFGKQFQYRH